MKFLNGMVPYSVGGHSWLTRRDLRLIDAAKNGDTKAVRALLAQHVPATAARRTVPPRCTMPCAIDNLEIADLLIAAAPT